MKKLSALMYENRFLPAGVFNLLFFLLFFIAAYNGKKKLAHDCLTLNAVLVALYCIQHTFRVFAFVAYAMH